MNLFLCSTARWLSACFGLLVATTFLGCGNNASQPTTPTCYLGDEESCEGEGEGQGGCIGLRKCNGRGTWGDCVCSTASSNVLGGACSDDGVCPVGATCLQPDSTDWLGGGPTIGLCVADCSEDPAICDGFANATCISADRADSSDGTHALCMPKCDPTVGTKAAYACSSVPSSACEPLGAANAGFCRPFCRFDGDCPSGHCDRQVGVCLAEAAPPHTQAFGDSCDPLAPNCDGVCLQLGANANICSNRCVFGSYSECAIEGASPIAGVCAYPAAQAMPGNIAYCTPLCDCNDDCAASGFVCQAFSATGTQTALEHVGMCVPAQDSMGATQAGVACGLP